MSAQSRTTRLDGFSRQHREAPVSVAKSDLRDGLRLAERATPLVGISHDRAGERISITVEESPFGEVTHTIRHPDNVAIEESAEADEDPRVAATKIPACAPSCTSLSTASRIVPPVEIMFSRAGDQHPGLAHRASQR